MFYYNYCKIYTKKTAKFGTKLQKLCYYVVKKERSKIIKQIKKNTELWQKLWKPTKNGLAMQKRTQVSQPVDNDNAGLKPP